MIYRKILLCSLSLLVLVSCDRTRSSTGWDYMPDMYYSNAYESYTPNPNFSDDMTMRMPVEGTVPREMVPFPFEKTEEDLLNWVDEYCNENLIKRLDDGGGGADSIGAERSAAPSCCASSSPGAPASAARTGGPPAG